MILYGKNVIECYIVPVLYSNLEEAQEGTGVSFRLRRKNAAR